MTHTESMASPKGLFRMALSRTNLISNNAEDDWQVEAAWTIFEMFMRQYGYLIEETVEDRQKE